MRESARTGEELREARLAMSRALEEARAEKERREALRGDLLALREKYSALKRRFVDAGRKVSAAGSCRQGQACNSREEPVENGALPIA